MQARIVSAAGGVRWLAEGWRLFRAAPLGWLGISLAYLFLTQVLGLVPVVGPLVALVLGPALWLGMMGCARAASHGAKVNLGMLFGGFRTELRGQLILGAIYAGVAVAIFALTIFADQDGGLRSMLRGGADKASLDDAALPLAVFVLLYLPILLAFWYAPPLVGWHSIPIVKSLFFSFLACAMNWRAFVAYAVAAAIFTGVPAFLVLMAFNLAEMKFNPWAAVFPLLVLALPTLFASLYASYRDVFRDPAVAPD